MTDVVRALAAIRAAREARAGDAVDFNGAPLEGDPRASQHFRAGDVVTDKRTGRKYVVEQVSTRRVLIPASRG